MVSVPPLTFVKAMPFVPPDDVTLVIVLATSATPFRMSPCELVLLIEPASVSVPPPVALRPVPPDDVVIARPDPNVMLAPAFVARLTAVFPPPASDIVPPVKPNEPPVFDVIEIAVAAVPFFVMLPLK